MQMTVLYLSQKGEVLDDQVGTLCLPCPTLPTNDDALNHRHKQQHKKHHTTNIHTCHSDSILSQDIIYCNFSSLLNIYIFKRFQTVMQKEPIVVSLLI